MAIMFLIFLLLLISSFEGLSEAEHGTLCTSNACFTLHMDGLSFKKARQSCEHNGGYLMTVRDREEEDVLRLLLSQIQRQPQDRALTFWIGLKLHRGNCMSADKTLKGFKWISGKEDSHYSNWANEPVATCIEDRCVSVFYTLSGESQLKWTAGPCKSPTFYVCKFYFQGMCRPLTLLGPGQINYTAPFSNEPQRTKMQSFPVGTYADILCSDQQSHYSYCIRMDGIFRWNVPGPFCKTGKQNCTINNGGCEHLCHQDADELRCFCREGYNLGEDGLTCRIKDLCGVDTCEHQCVMSESGYSCKCPDGFKLDVNQRNCSDIDECQSQACDHFCVNTAGSYTCVCNDGYEMVDGKCSDIDECAQFRCEHNCLNSIGSFSCNCDQGFTLSENGSCVKDCPQGFHMETDGLTCVPDLTKILAASSDDSAEEETQENVTESFSRTVELQHQSPHTDAPLPDVVNVTHSDQQSNVSSVTSFASTVNFRVLICVLGSVVPLLLLVAVTLAIAIFRCSHSKKETKKNTTTDGYCWVSSGFDPRLEKLYESISTDGL
ncbi:uncharacterized protein cd93 [Pagrus major]|uniref:uncharacterized protein cd93 n=1 Tax=Pagrus major TaxID=143350 RepID=UPI003CC8C68D